MRKWVKERVEEAESACGSAWLVMVWKGARRSWAGERSTCRLFRGQPYGSLPSPRLLEVPQIAIDYLDLLNRIFIYSNTTS